MLSINFIIMLIKNYINELLFNIINWYLCIISLVVVDKLHSHRLYYSLLLCSMTVTPCGQLVVEPIWQSLSGTHPLLDCHCFLLFAFAWRSSAQVDLG